jgi:hypothetical protein
MTLALTAALRGRLETVMKAYGVTEGEAIEALKWISNPTIRPIVGIREFINSPYYMNAIMENGKSAIYDLVMDELEKMNDGTYSEAVLTGSIGAAKCLGFDTPIIMYDGTVKKVQDIGIGDLLMGPDSLPRRVTSMASGSDEMYRVTQIGGDPYVINSAHVLSLKYTESANHRKKKGEVRNLSVTDYLALPKSHKGVLKGWRPDWVDFQSTKVEDPYLMGVWLGDGTSASAAITNMDPEIISYLKSAARSRRLLLIEMEDKRGNQAKRWTFCTYGGRVGQNSVLNWLKTEGVLNNKHVPHKYLTASAGDRRLLLAGLIDTDGSLSNGGYVISQKRRVLSDAIGFIARSLGLRVSVNEDVINGTMYYRSFIYGDVDQIPVRITRKKAKPRLQKKCPQMWGITVESIGRGRYYGFELEGPDRLFLLGDFTVTHNTTCALYTTAYQLYLLSCYSSPHALYDLDPASEIVFIFQSLNAKAARAVDYERFKSMIENSPYFKTYFPFDKELTAELHFPNRIIVRPVSGSETAAIGQNVFGGIIDEVNFMAVIEGGKNAGEDGTYDQAVALYNSISKRRKSRFGVMGKVPGMLCIVSSRRYPGQFTDIKEAEARADTIKYGRSTIFVYDKRTWEIKPPGSFSTERFQVFIGDEARRPRILEKGEAKKLGPSYEGLIVDIPIDFEDDFERDILSSLRDIAGVATLAKHPFIVNREKIKAAMRKDYIAFQRERVDFEETQLSIIASELYKPSLPRFFHCDLAITGDSAGFAIGTVLGFKSVTVVEGAVEMLPIIHIDALLEIAPPKGGEIKLHKVRDIIHTLRKLGLNIKWGTFDQFQSRDSMQLLKQSGLAIGYQSVDINTVPYDFVKNALYDERLSLPNHAKVGIELASLEKLVKRNKVDHPPGGSKDVADALAGVVYGLTMRREIWALYGVSAVALPSVIKQAIDKEKSDKLNTKV